MPQARWKLLQRIARTDGFQRLRDHQKAAGGQDRCDYSVSDGESRTHTVQTSDRGVKTDVAFLKAVGVAVETLKGRVETVQASVQGLPAR